MKKSVLSVILAGSMALSLTACQTGGKSAPADAAAAAETEAESQKNALSEETVAAEVTITDFDGNSVTLMQNPKKVAVYDYAILDMLNAVGFEKSGIEQLIVPTKDKLPEALSYYREQDDDKVLTGGTMFYVDRDVLDLVQPDLVILGARSFAADAAGDSLSAGEKEKMREDTETRYSKAAFAKLTVNAKDSSLLPDMEKNVEALAAIFPQIAPDLEARFGEIKAEVSHIHDKAQASEKRALFAMMVDQTSLSVFHPSSRFDMLYEEFGFAPASEEAVEWTDQHGFDVRAEYILQTDPDVIFLLDRSATVGTGAGADNFLNDPIIKQTRASQNGDIYVLSGDAWYTMTGGFNSVETMIADINQYIKKLN